jgi:hypothetical protein
VLVSLRQASQKLRVRQGFPRICVGWQLGGLEIPDLTQAGVVLPLRPMSIWRLLSLLEQRLVDVALMGLMEFEGMLGHPLSRLRARRMPLSSSMLCIPVGAYELQLMAHRQHPLQGNGELDPEQLAQFPSPALPLGMAPVSLVDCMSMMKPVGREWPVMVFHSAMARPIAYQHCAANTISSPSPMNWVSVSASAWWAIAM